MLETRFSSVETEHLHFLSQTMRPLFEPIQGLLSETRGELVIWASHFDRSPLLECVCDTLRKSVSGRMLLQPVVTETWSALQAAGARVHFIDRRLRMHAKLLISDDVVVLGSVNWFERSLRQDHESVVVVSSPALARWLGDWTELIGREYGHSPADNVSGKRGARRRRMLLEACLWIIGGAAFVAGAL